MSGEKIFYIVARMDDGDGKLRQLGESHHSEALARRCAQKTAELNDNIRFYVLRVQEYFEAEAIAKSTMLLQSQEDTDGKES